MVERRCEVRLRSLLGGRVAFHRLNSTMDCVVRNIAPHGAMIVFPQAAVTPTEFTLFIPQRGETYAASVVWRHGDRAGIVLSDRAKTGVPEHRACHLRRLWTESRAQTALHERKSG